MAHERRQRLAMVLVFVAIVAGGGALVELIYLAVRWALGG